LTTQTNALKDVFDETTLNALARAVMLKSMDTSWISYLQELDYLREGIGLRGFAQRDPLTEYRQEAYEAFGTLVTTMYADALEVLLRMKPAARPDAAETVDATNAA
jgi:preprotein translocase subunit SecA